MQTAAFPFRRIGLVWVWVRTWEVARGMELKERVLEVMNVYDSKW